MRTLQEKYNGIQEGKFSKEHFLADARMELPNLVTRFNGYDDAVQILKNRGMIQEARVAYDVPMIDNQRAAFDKLSDLYFEYLRKYAKSKGDNTSMSNSQLGDKYREEIETKLGLPPHSAYADLAKELKNRGMIQEAKIEEARLTKNNLTDYRYKPTNDMDKYPYEQILRGIRVELEGLGVQGTPTAEEYAKALAKVSKNLAKDSIFYTNQVAGVNPKVDLHDKMIPVTAKNTVDTFNGMKKAELKEGFKRLIKKVLSESMGDMFGDEERAERSANYGQPGKNDYEFYSDPENYNEEEEFELQGDEEADDIPHPRGYEEASDEEDLDESKMGDLYITAQESDSLKDFLIKVKQEYPETNLRRDIEELQHIWNNRGEDSEDELSEGKKSLSELLK